MKHRFCLTLLLLLTFCTGLHAAEIRQKTIKKVKYCNLYDLLSMNKFRVSLGKKEATAFGRSFACIFKRDQRRLVCNNVKIELLSALSFDGVQPWISTLDWYKTLRPVLYPATVPRRPVKLIMIDMGHGGNDPGAIGKISKEKMITLQVGMRVAQLLKSYGFQVAMTRTTDVQVPLSQVGVLQKRSKSDLFVSIHVNSAANRSVTGIETYCLTPAGAVSSNGGSIDKKTYPGNKQDDGNMLLAWNIQRSLLRRTGAVDRGVKRARFAVLKDINAPGVLVEIGFISNAGEEKKHNDRSYIDKIAFGIIDGIVGYAKDTRVWNK